MKKYRVEGRKDLYDKQTGADHKGAQYRHFAIATPEEIAAYQAKQDRQRQEKVAEEERQRQTEATRQTLLNLFNNLVYMEHDATTNRWQVTFHGLTESEVRKLSTKLG